MCANWGYGKLPEVIEKRAIDEMRHAEMLTARILFLEGKPTVSKLAEIHVGDKVQVQFKNDLA
jgi:bacterioferritin